MISIVLQDIGLSAASLRAVERKARQEGKTPPEYVRSLIERNLLADKTFDEIVKPIRADFHKKGVTEEQLDQLVQRARKATSRKRQRSRR